MRPEVCALAESRMRRVEKTHETWFQLYHGPEGLLHEWTHTVAFDAYVLDKIDFCADTGRRYWGQEARWNDGPEIQALMDKLDVSVCFVDRCTRPQGLRPSWYYSRGEWKKLETKEAISTYSSQADLCFVVQFGDTQLAWEKNGEIPKAPQFFPLVRLDTGAFWYAGDRIRSRCEALFKKSIWSSNALVNGESHAMQRRHACYFSLLRGMKVEITMELKRSLSDNFFFHMEDSENNVETAPRSQGSVGLGTQASPPMAGLRRLSFEI